MTNATSEQNSDVPYKWDNFYAKVIYYRHYKYCVQERTTTQAVQEVASWIEQYVPHEHEEYPFLQRIVDIKLRELASQPVASDSDS